MKCATKGCKNEALKYRKYCATCRTRQYSKTNPINYTYLNLRKRAAQRGKIFTLTLEEFTKFCELTGYIDKKGKFAEGASIDCKISKLGYQYFNIRMVTLSVNSKLRNGTLDPEWIPLDYCPF